jgi:hypothetical protein
LICAFIGIRRKKLVDKIAMSAMNLYGIKSGLPCPTTGIPEFRNDPLDIF